MNPCDSHSAKPLAVIKVGSTSISVLVAATLTHPLYDDVQIRHLIRHQDGPAVLRESLRHLKRDVQALAPRGGLVAFGEAGRHNPALPAEAVRAGYAVWVLSGEEEGACSWWSEQPWRTVPITVLDVGGGSTEFAGPWGSVSTPFGAEQPPPPDTPVPAAVRREGPLVAMGGTARALGTVFGSPIARQTLAAYADRPFSTWPRVHLVEADRRPLLSGGLATMLWAMDGLRADEVAVTPRDLRWGLWLAACLGRAGRWPGG